MREVLAALLVLVPAPSQAWAEALTLVCSGSSTTTEVHGDTVASDPKTEDVVDFSVVADFDKRAVTGFWTEISGAHTAIPITAVDANGISFKGRRVSPSVGPRGNRGVG